MILPFQLWSFYNLKSTWLMYPSAFLFQLSVVNCNYSLPVTQIKSRRYPRGNSYKVFTGKQSSTQRCSREVPILRLGNTMSRTKNDPIRTVYYTLTTLLVPLDSSCSHGSACTVNIPLVLFTSQERATGRIGIFANIQVLPLLQLCSHCGSNGKFGPSKFRCRVNIYTSHDTHF